MMTRCARREGELRLGDAVRLVPGHYSTEATGLQDLYAESEIFGIIIGGTPRGYRVCVPGYDTCIPCVFPELLLPASMDSLLASHADHIVSPSQLFRSDDRNNCLLAMSHQEYYHSGGFGLYSGAVILAASNRWAIVRSLLPTSHDPLAAHVVRCSIIDPQDASLTVDLHRSVNPLPAVYQGHVGLGPRQTLQVWTHNTRNEVALAQLGEDYYFLPAQQHSGWRQLLHDPTLRSTNETIPLQLDVGSRVQLRPLSAGIRIPPRQQGYVTLIVGPYAQVSFIDLPPDSSQQLLPWHYLLPANWLAQPANSTDQPQEVPILPMPPGWRPLPVPGAGESCDPPDLAPDCDCGLGVPENMEVTITEVLPDIRPALPVATVRDVSTFEDAMDVIGNQGLWMPAASHAIEATPTVLSPGAQGWTLPPPWGEQFENLTDADREAVLRNRWGNSSAAPAEEIGGVEAIGVGDWIFSEQLPGDRTGIVLVNDSSAYQIYCPSAQRQVCYRSASALQPCHVQGKGTYAWQVWVRQNLTPLIDIGTAPPLIYPTAQSVEGEVVYDYTNLYYVVAERIGDDGYRQLRLRTLGRSGHPIPACPAVHVESVDQSRVHGVELLQVRIHRSDLHALHDYFRRYFNEQYSFDRWLTLPRGTVPVVVGTASCWFTVDRSAMHSPEIIVLCPACQLHESTIGEQEDPASEARCVTMLLRTNSARMQRIEILDTEVPVLYLDCMRIYPTYGPGEHVVRLSAEPDDLRDATYDEVLQLVRSLPVVELYRGLGGRLIAVWPIIGNCCDGATQRNFAEYEILRTKEHHIVCVNKASTADVVFGMPVAEVTDLLGSVESVPRVVYGETANDDASAPLQTVCFLQPVNTKFPVTYIQHRYMRVTRVSDDVGTTTRIHTTKLPKIPLQNRVILYGNSTPVVAADPQLQAFCRWLMQCPLEHQPYLQVGRTQLHAAGFHPVLSLYLALRYYHEHGPLARTAFSTILATEISCDFDYLIAAVPQMFVVQSAAAVNNRRVISLEEPLNGT